jgi:chromate transporter
MNPLTYFLLALKASLVSNSGLGNVPSLHDDLIGRGWATEREFAEAIAVGQVSPGPNGLWVVSLGYLLDGGRGALLSLIVIVLPPLLVLGIERLYRRIAHLAAVDGFLRGLNLAVVGVFVVVLLGLLTENGIDAASIAIGAVSIVLAHTRRVPVIAIVLLAALAGILTGH